MTTVKVKVKFGPNHEDDENLIFDRINSKLGVIVAYSLPFS
jgi:hypothetical protein